MKAALMKNHLTDKRKKTRSFVFILMQIMKNRTLMQIINYMSVVC